MNNNNNNVMLLEKFCSTLNKKYRIRFSSRRIPMGVVVVGEYQTNMNRVMSLMMTTFVNRNVGTRVEIYDDMRRLVFRDTVMGDITKSNKKIINFIEKSISAIH